jgi:FHA domain-containing protein
VDPLDLIILALRVLLVVLLYAFLWTVLRATSRALHEGQTPSVTPLRLVVVDPGASGMQTGGVLVVQEGAVLGRGEPADVTLADPAVSVEHARVARVHGEWVVRDLDSTNGTRLNDVPVDGDTELTQGDILALGNVRLQVDTV